MFSKLKQIKDLREKAKKAQDVFGKIAVEGEGARGRVKVRLNGNFRVEGVEVDAGLLAPDRKKDVENGVKDAVEDAVKKVQKDMAALMRKGDVELPDLKA